MRRCVSCCMVELEKEKSVERLKNLRVQYGMVLCIRYGCSCEECRVVYWCVSRVNYYVVKKDGLVCVLSDEVYVYVVGLIRVGLLFVDIVE